MNSVLLHGSGDADLTVVPFHFTLLPLLFPFSFSPFCFYFLSFLAHAERNLKKENALSSLHVCLTSSSKKITAERIFIKFRFGEF
jgi:hypothetical protein